jgi:AmiR/NasT family two-component response regulator
MNTSVRTLFDDLRDIRVVIVHPPGEDCKVLAEQIKRIGCQVRTIWPLPPAPPADAEVVFFLVGQELHDSSAWCSSEVDATLIALTEYENPTTLKLVLGTHAHGVIAKPFRSSGILTTLMLARSTRGYHQRLNNKVRKLEDTLKARRQIERGVRLLMEGEHLSENDAYDLIRSRATKLRITVAEVAALVIEAHEAMDKLGLKLKRP